MATVSPANKRRIERHIKKVAEALITARKERPKADHYTAETLRKLGAPPGHAVRNVVRDHRYGLYVALNKLAQKKNLDRWRRAPYYESRAVFP